jgi:hypothetical protein
VVAGKPTSAIIRPILRLVMSIWYLPKRLEVVFIVWMEYCSSVIDRRVVKSCVVLCNLCVRKVYVRYEVIFGRVRIVVIDVFKAIFLSFKLVKQPFESDKNLLDSAMATSSAASFKQACSLCKWA